MIGNDIVDLNLAKQESNWHRKGFLEKIFTPDELDFFHSTDINQDAAVWLMWSMKETAYKMITQRTNSRFYAPKKFNCQLTEIDLEKETAFGIVQYLDQIILTKSSIHSNFIYTASKEDQHFEYNQTYGLLDDEGKTGCPPTSLSQRLVDYYCASLAIDSSQIKFQKNENNIPTLINMINEKTIAVSLTHHGAYAGFCFEN